MAPACFKNGPVALESRYWMTFAKCLFHLRIPFATNLTALTTAADLIPDGDVTSDPRSGLNTEAAETGVPPRTSAVHVAKIMANFKRKFIIGAPFFMSMMAIQYGALISSNVSELKSKSALVFVNPSGRRRPSYKMPPSTHTNRVPSTSAHSQLGKSIVMLPSIFFNRCVSK